MALHREDIINKGLSNDTGENNCFLNVVIQSLWHLTEFRTKFKEQATHQHDERSACIFCALEIIFTQFRFGEESTLPPTALRNALSDAFSKESRFQVGKLDDAAEALEEVLNCLHRAAIRNKSNSEDTATCEPPCFIHNLFNITLLEQQICSASLCQATSEPITSNLFIYYSYAAAIRHAHSLYPSLSFAQLLKLVTSRDKRKCPNQTCSSLCSVEQFVLNLPSIFQLGFVWDSSSPTVSEISEILNIISDTLDLSEVFQSSLTNCTYRLRGMICYYGKHYDAYFHSDGVWWVFDDAMVKKLSTNWEDIKIRCEKGKWQPFVLFYELEKNHEKEIKTQSVYHDKIGEMYAKSYLNTMNNASKIMNYDTRHELPRRDAEIPRKEMPPTRDVRREYEVPRRDLETTDHYDFLNATPTRLTTTTSTLSPYSQYRKSIPVSSYNTAKTTSTTTQTTESRIPPSGLNGELRETTPPSYFRSRTSPSTTATNTVNYPERPPHFLSSAFYDALNKKVKRGDDAYP